MSVPHAACHVLRSELSTRIWKTNPESKILVLVLAKISNAKVKALIPNRWSSKFEGISKDSSNNISIPATKKQHIIGQIAATVFHWHVSLVQIFLRLNTRGRKWWFFPNRQYLRNLCNRQKVQCQLWMGDGEETKNAFVSWIIGPWGPGSGEHIIWRQSGDDLLSLATRSIGWGPKRTAHCF